MTVVLISAVIFVAVISADLFACGFAYGASKVTVPFEKITLINIIGKVIIGGGLFLGWLLGGLVPPLTAVWLGFAILSALGFVKVLQWIAVRGKPQSEVKRNISWRESAVLGVLLSFDGFAAGIGAAISDISTAFIITVLGISVVSDQLVFIGAQSLGKSLTKKASPDLGWLSGVILIAVAVCKLFFELFT